MRQNTHLHRHREGSWAPDPCSTERDARRAELPASQTYLLGGARSAFG